jgi:hypothetical protein
MNMAKRFSMGNEEERRRLLIQALKAETSGQACQKCLERLDAYVSAQLSGEDYLARFPEVALHLDLCSDCSAAYARIYDLELAALTGNLPQPEHIPPPDLSFLTARAETDEQAAPSLSERLKDFLTALDPANWQSRPVWQSALALALMILLLGGTLYLLTRPDGGGVVAQLATEPATAVVAMSEVTRPAGMTPATAALTEPAASAVGPLPTPTNDIGLPAGLTAAPSFINTPPAGCLFGLPPDFAHYYQDAAAALGCPLEEAAEVILVQQGFQNGRMIWREDAGTIYVVYDDAEWDQFEDTWTGDEPEFTCGDPISPPTPRRGFGKVWCTFDEVRQGLGQAIRVETQGSNLLQEFENGLLLLIDGKILLLLSDGTWE